jgi:F-type H+-transporting ATPase subunit b
MRRRPIALLAPPTALSIAALAVSPAARAAEGHTLQIQPHWQQVVPLLVLFVVLVPVLNALLFRPLLDVLEEREKRIEGARVRAAELAREAAALAARHEAALQQAREAAHAEQVRHLEDARSQHQAAVGAARQEAEQQLAAARAEITAAAAVARAALGAETDSLARDIAARLLGGRAA